MLLAGAKDVHFSCFYSSCQLGQMKVEYILYLKNQTYFKNLNKAECLKCKSVLQSWQCSDYNKFKHISEER